MELALGVNEQSKTCRLCGGEVDAAPLQTHETSARLACGQCGVEFWWPLHMANAAWYARHGTTTADVTDSLLRPGHRRFLSVPPVTHGRLLDIGCGHGLFLEQVRVRLSLDPWGIDWDPGAVDFGRRLRGLPNLYDQSLETFAAGRAQQFDAVTMFEVLEHQEDPMELLQRATMLLKPGGALVGSVPNRTRWVVGPRETWDYPPHHLYWFHAKSLSRLLERAGFQRIRVCALLDVSVLVNQVLAKVSLGVAARLVRMPQPLPAYEPSLPADEWRRVKTLPPPLGYRVTTALKKIALSPFLVPAVMLTKAIPSWRHVLYFEGYRP